MYSVSDFFNDPAKKCRFCRCERGLLASLLRSYESEKSALDFAMQRYQAKSICYQFVTDRCRSVKRCHFLHPPNHKTH